MAQSTMPGEMVENDPVRFSLILNRLDSITEEMTLTLERSARTAILAVSRDFSCAIFDRDCRQIAMHDALPVHTNSFNLLIAEIAGAFGDDIHDGDVFICNDPSRYNTHIADLVTALPVFVDGELLFWAATRGHQLDVGAFVPASMSAAATNVWEEGLCIPPLKLVDRGRMRKDVVELYLANVRYRELLHADLLAQLGSIEKGRQRLLEMVDVYGVDDLRRYTEQMIVYARRRMVDEIRRMPDGTYRAEGWIDSDSYDLRDIPVRVEITIRDGHVTVDYSDSAPQARGGVNGSVATTRAAGAMPFLYYVSADIPHNQGAIDQITVQSRPGTICNASYPASTSCATVVPSNLMSDIVNMALAEAMPEKVLAGIARSSNTPQLSGDRGWDGEPWGVMVFNNRGGMGAAADVDGWPIFGSHASFGGLKSHSIEQLELIYPFEVEYMEIEPDSMGFGKQIGGAGVRMSVVPCYGTIECITFGDGARNPPHGVAGGTAASGGGHYVEARDGTRTFAASAARLNFSEGERYAGVSPGGGGHGNPLDRDLETLRRNVRDGVVSREAARTVFGVVFTDDDDPRIDEAPTAALRTELAGRRRPAYEPGSPNSSRWIERNFRDGDTVLA